MQEKYLDATTVARLLGGTERALMRLRRDVAELRETVERQAATIAWLKEENARHGRNHHALWAHVEAEFARAFMWIDAIGCRVLPGAVRLANAFAEKIGRPAIVPPHRLGGRARGKVS